MSAPAVLAALIKNLIQQDVFIQIGTVAVTVLQTKGMELVEECMQFWSDIFSSHPCRVRCMHKVHVSQYCVIVVCVFFEDDNLSLWTKDHFTTLYITMNRTKYLSEPEMVLKIDKLFGTKFLEIITACSEHRPHLDVDATDN